MKYFTFIFIGSAIIFFSYEIFRQIKKDKKVVWKNISAPWVGILLAIMVLLHRLNITDCE